MKKITVVLGLMFLSFDLAFASYNVGILDVFPRQSSTSAILASLSEKLNSPSIKSVVIGKDDLQGKNGSMFALYDCVLVRGDANLTKEDVEALHAFAKAGKELVFLGKVDFESIVYPNKDAMRDLSSLSYFATAFFGDYMAYDLEDVSSIKYYKQGYVKSSFDMEGSFSGTQATSAVFLKESVLVPLLKAKNKYGRDVGNVGSMTFHYNGPFAGGTWILFGVEQDSFYANPKFSALLKDVLKSVSDKRNIRNISKKNLNDPHRKIKIKSPAMPKLTIKDGHFYKPDGSRFFIIGSNFFDSLYGFYSNDTHWDVDLLEADFKRMSEAGINAVRVYGASRFASKAHPERLDALVESARRYKIYILPNIIDHSQYFLTKKAMQDEIVRMVTALKGYNVFLGYDLQNEPYAWKLKDLKDGGVTLGEKYPGWKDWGKYYEFANFKKDSTWTTTFPDFQGDSLPIPEDPILKKALSDTNSIMATWIDWYYEAIRSVDKEKYITVGYNTVLDTLPANKRLDFVSHHCYELPTDYKSIMDNVTTLDRLRRVWPDRPITIGEFAYSGGYVLPDGDYIDIYTQALGEVLHYLYALANDFDGVMRWETCELSRAGQYRLQVWNRDKSYGHNVRERRFGMYYPDGSYSGRPKPVVHGLKFLRKYVDAGNLGGVIAVKPGTTRFGTVYEYSNDNALFVGDVKYESEKLSFNSNKAANVMLTWNKNEIEVLATCDVEVVINTKEILKNKRAKAGKLRISGDFGSFEKLSEGKIKIMLLEGNSIKIK